MGGGALSSGPASVFPPSPCPGGALSVTVTISADSEPEAQRTPSLHPTHCFMPSISVSEMFVLFYSVAATFKNMFYLWLLWIWSREEASKHQLTMSCCPEIREVHFFIFLCQLKPNFEPHPMGLAENATPPLPSQGHSRVIRLAWCPEEHGEPLVIVHCGDPSLTSFFCPRVSSCFCAVLCAQESSPKPTVPGFSLPGGTAWPARPLPGLFSWALLRSWALETANVSPLPNLRESLFLPPTQPLGLGFHEMGLGFYKRQKEPLASSCFGFLPGKKKIPGAKKLQRAE